MQTKDASLLHVVHTKALAALAKYCNLFTFVSTKLSFMTDLEQFKCKDAKTTMMAPDSLQSTFGKTCSFA